MWFDSTYSPIFSSLTAPFLFTLIPRTLAFLLPANVSNVFIPQGMCTVLLYLERSLLSLFLRGCPLFIIKCSERPTLITLLPLSSSPRHTCRNLFYFYPNTNHSLKFSYLYTCLWPVFPSNMFRAVSSATRLLPGSQERHHRYLLNERMNEWIQDYI